MGKGVPLQTVGSQVPHLAFGMGRACGVCFLQWSLERTAIAQETLSSRPLLSRVLEQVCMDSLQALTFFFQLQRELSATYSFGPKVASQSICLLSFFQSLLYFLSIIIPRLPSDAQPEGGTEMSAPAFWKQKLSSSFWVYANIVFLFKKNPKFTLPANSM